MWPKRGPNTHGREAQQAIILNLGFAIGANDRLLHPPLSVATNQARLRRRGGDDNLLIRSQASHLTALVVYGLSDAMPARVHITVDRPFAGLQHGVVVHTSSLQPDETTRREGITVTSPLRTIADVAATDQQLASQALGEGLERGIIRRRQIDLEADRYPDVMRLINSLEAT